MNKASKVIEAVGLDQAKEFVHDFKNTRHSPDGGPPEKGAKRRLASNVGWFAVMFSPLAPIARVAKGIYRGKDHPSSYDLGAPTIKFMVGRWPPILRVFFRFWQFLMALIVIGMYSIDLIKAKKDNQGTDPRWLYVVILATISALTALFQIKTWVAPWLLGPYNAVLFLCWMVGFGIFGKMYIPDQEHTRMRHGAYILAVNMVLWFTTATFYCLGTWQWWIMRKSGGSDVENQKARS